MSKKIEHILVVSQYFYPEQFRINDICREWVKRGYKITVLTGIPNYPRGEYFEGYDKEHRRRETVDGIDIVRLPIRPRYKGAKNLFLNYVSFVIEGKKWLRKNDIKADAVFCYEVSPMTQALVSVAYSKRYKIPHYIYVTDLWPENVEIVAGIHNPVILSLIQKMSDYIYKNSKKILTSSKSFIKAIEKRKIDRKNIEFWPQYAEDFYRPVEESDKNEIQSDGIFNIVFAGNIGFAQGLSILIGAAKLLKKDGLKARFNIIGDGRYLDTLKNDINSNELSDYFNLISRKPAEEIPLYAARADALLITLSKSKVFSITIPAKTQSCLACAKPILLSADGEVQDIIKEASAGLVSDAEDVLGLYKNIVCLMNLSGEERKAFGRAGLEYSRKYFDKTKLLDRFDKIMEEE